MRSRHSSREKLHMQVQSSWSGWGTSVYVADENSNMPQDNPEWDKLSSLACRYFDDVIGANFISRRSHDELIVNPMQSVGWSLTNPQIYQNHRCGRHLADGSVYDYSCLNTWSSLTYSGVTYLTGPNPPTSHDAAFDLVRRLFSATDHTSKVAQAIIEAQNAATVRFRTDYADMVDILLSDRDAYHMLPGLLKQVSRLTLDFERKRLVAIASDMSKLWLAYRYGVRPLLYDITTILQHLSKKGAVRRSFRSRSNSIHSEKTWSDRRYGIMSDRAFDSCETHAVSLISVRSQIRAGITADLVCDTSEGGFRWDRILPTIWDLTPYSFLVDWLLNVSDWLANFAPSPQVRQQVGFVTHSCNISVQGSAYASEDQSQFPIREDSLWSPGDFDLAESHSFSDKGYTLLGTFKSRISFTPDVTLHFDPISWISASHLADLLAIIMGFKSVRTSIRRLPMLH